jgi:hypothetical protein
MRLPEYSILVKRLESALVQSALDYGKSTSCGIDDLCTLGSREALLQLATNETAPVAVRIVAAHRLRELGLVTESNSAF